MITILLLGIMLINITGYHFMFYVQRIEIRQAMKKKLHQHLSAQDSEQFVFSLNEKNTLESPQWEGEDEFEYKGEMYDVLEKKILDGKLYVHCISDKKETSLLKKYLGLSKDDFGGSSKKKTILLLNLINGLYTNPATAINTLFVSLLPDHYSYYNCPIFSSDSDILTPPPRVS